MKREKRPTILFAAVFVAIVVLMIMLNYRTTHVYELNGPSAGVYNLSTRANRLVAISRENDIYRWNWNSLTAMPEIGRVDGHKVAALASGRIMWVVSGEKDLLLVGDSKKGEKIEKKLPLDGMKKCRFLQAGGNGKYAALAIESKGSIGKTIELAVTDCNLSGIRLAATKVLRDKLKVSNVPVSNDGTLAACVGVRQLGWIMLASASERRILWEQRVEDCNELDKVVFSPNGKLLYASEPGREVYVFDSASGKLLKRMEIGKYNTPPNNPQVISSLALSPDGRFVAAATEPASDVWVWNSRTGAKVTVITSESNTVSGLAFSPDSSLLATGVLVSSTINVWKLPKAD